MKCSVEAIWAQFICHLIICLQLTGSALHLAGLPAAQLALQSLSVCLSITHMCVHCSLCVCVCLKAYLHARLFLSDFECVKLRLDLWIHCSFFTAVYQIYIWPTDQALHHNCTMSRHHSYIYPLELWVHIYLCMCVLLQTAIKMS